MGRIKHGLMSSKSYAILILTLFHQLYRELRDIVVEQLPLTKRDKPWMKYKELDLISEVLEKLQPEKVLEWGAGYSTLHFPNRLKNTAEWYGVEHNEEWANLIRRINKNPKVEIIHISPDHFPWTDPENDGAYEDLKQYLEYPTKLGKFDFIFIDGRARRECLKKALEIINDDGVVVLHDANRKYYHEPFQSFKNAVLFSDDHRSCQIMWGGIWLGSKGRDLKTVLDITKHERLFKCYQTIKKIIRKR